MVGRCTQLTEDKGLMEVCGLCSMGWAGRVLMIWRRARVVDLLRGRVHHNDLVHGLVELRCHPLGVAEALLHVLGHLLYLVEVGWAKRTVAMTARNPVSGERPGNLAGIWACEIRFGICKVRRVRGSKAAAGARRAGGCAGFHLGPCPPLLQRCLE